MDYWDRRFLKSRMELDAIKGALKSGDGQKAAKKLKKIRKFFKSPLGEVARLDNSLYNVKESTQETLDGDQGSTTTGDDSATGESAQT
tara:strand:+ start:10398 stop:10661 length:264 start_codon:yes stop_codon:yes gene_type:complete